MNIKKCIVLFALPILLGGCSTIATHSQTSTNTVENVTTNTVSNSISNSLNNLISNSVSNTSNSTQPNSQIPANLVTPYSQEMQHVLNDLSTQTKTPLYAPTGKVGSIVKYNGTDWTYEIELASGVWIFGTTYQDHSSARAALNQNFVVTKTTDDGAIAPSSPLHQYQTGKTYSNGLSQAVIDWNEGKWQIDVFGAPSFDLITTAKTLYSYLMPHELPPTDGRLFVDQSTETNALPQTQIGLVFGDTYYLVEGQNMNDTLTIATSLRPVSSPEQ